mmetsp:Transcript_117869/g.240905  ORF Transcript_117869/g.240905 Transcript_117869/m.240905 type:complete len:87 (+) Transcript_117869:354-614(+)
MVYPFRSGMQLDSSLKDGFLSSFQHLFAFVVTAICLPARKGYRRTSAQKITSFPTMQNLGESCTVNGCNQLHSSLCDGFRCVNLIS